MIFKLTTERDLNFDFIKLVSEGGEWELGIWSTLFGKRIRMGRPGAGGVNLDYCAGADPILQLKVLNAVRIILLEVPEEVSDIALERMFPVCYVKPIDLDERCWPKLKQMRDDVRQRLRIADEFLPFIEQAAA